MTSLAGLVRQVARVGYDRLGGLLALNLAWDLAVAPWALAGWAAIVALDGAGGGVGPRLAISLAAVQFVALSPPTALICAAGEEWLDGAGADLVHLVRTRRRGLVRAQMLGAGAAVATAVLAMNAVFYHSIGGWLGAALAGSMVWLLVALQLVSLYLLPAAVAGSTTSAWGALRQAAALAAGHPGYSAGLLGLALMIAAAGAFSGAGLLLGLTSVTGLLLTAGYRRVLPPGTRCSTAPEAAPEPQERAP